VPLIPDETEAELWMTTAELGTARPYGLASSPDGLTLYVGCVGDGSNGKVLAINVGTKAVTTIATGLIYLKHGLDVDSAGNLYWSTGANLSDGDTALYKWDGSTITEQFPASDGFNYWGLDIDHEDRFWFGDYPNIGYRLASRTEAGATLSYSQLGLEGETDVGRQGRGIAVSDNYVVVAMSNSSQIQVWDRNNVANDNGTAGELPGTPMVGDHPATGVFAVDDEEFYVLSQVGTLVRLDPFTLTQTPITVEDMPEQLADGGFGDIERVGSDVFISCGAWNAARFDSGVPPSAPYDVARGTDVGIYRISLGVSGWRFFVTET
jgi:hypothetical protein